MALPMIYSRRKRLAQQDQADVYQYESMSPKLRQQILFVLSDWNSHITTYSRDLIVFKFVIKHMRKELGAPALSNYAHDDEDEFSAWFLSFDNLDHLINSIEFAIIGARSVVDYNIDGPKTLIDGIAEINARSLEDGFGFQIEGGQFIQIGNKFNHKQIIVPALHLLSGVNYSEANKEFRQAFNEFNLGNYDDCIHDCCNAFESVLKVILTKKKWEFSPNDTASKLIAIVFNNGLIPPYMQTEFAGLRTILESGVPTVRNKEAGHGTGTVPRLIPKHVAMFQLQQTAAAISLLVEAAK